MIRTFHQFIHQNPPNPNYKRAIIGTIHPHRVENFGIEFFYGNRGFLWDILSQAFPELDFSTVDSIKSILSGNKIWITDMIEECDREDEGETRDSHLKNLALNTRMIEEGLRNSQIDTIFFTSRFGKNGAASLFCKEFDIDLGTWNEELSQFTIPASKFGREIKGVVLFSPSGRANMGIGRSAAFRQMGDLYASEPGSVKKFKIHFYRDKFNFLV